MTGRAKPARKNAPAKRPAAEKAAAKNRNKTQPTGASVEAFIDGVENETRRRDARTLLALMTKVTGESAKMWGPSIIGFGTYHYKYESGREGDFLMTGFSPRKTATVVYVMGGVPETDELYKKLGKHKLGKSCLYINKLEDVDLGVLEKLIARSVAHMRKTYGA
ncbi:MAG: hypothetical protein Kow00133_04910 [Amphiplicatus sp.]